MSRLPVLDEEIDARARAVVEARPDWPCQAGCAHCCRSLAEPLTLSDPEWARLHAALAQRPEANALMGRLASAAGRVCPLLGADDRCLVYDARPIACRTYGFYVAEDGDGRWCRIISARSDLADTVLGHEGHVVARLPQKRRVYVEWLKDRSDPRDD